MDPGGALAWDDFFHAMLWLYEIPIPSLAGLEDVPELDNVPKRNNLSSRILHTAFDKRLIRRSFDPREPLTRGRALELMAEIYGLSLDTQSENQVFSDVGPDDSLYEIIQAADKQNWFDGISQSRLRPDRDMTREMFCFLVYLESEYRQSVYRHSSV